MIDRPHTSVEGMPKTFAAEAVDHGRFPPPPRFADGRHDLLSRELRRGPGPRHDAARRAEFDPVRTGTQQQSNRLQHFVRPIDDQRRSAWVIRYLVPGRDRHRRTDQVTIKVTARLRQRPDCHLEIGARDIASLHRIPHTGINASRISGQRHTGLQRPV